MEKQENNLDPKEKSENETQAGVIPVPSVSEEKTETKAAEDSAADIKKRKRKNIIFYDRICSDHCLCDLGTCTVEQYAAGGEFGDVRRDDRQYERLVSPFSRGAFYCRVYVGFPQVYVAEQV